MNEFINLAIAEAKKGLRKNHGGPFGAIIVKDGKVISSAHNEVLKNINVILNNFVIQKTKYTNRLNNNPQKNELSIFIIR